MGSRGCFQGAPILANLSNSRLSAVSGGDPTHHDIASRTLSKRVLAATCEMTASASESSSRQAGHASGTDVASRNHVNARPCSGDVVLRPCQSFCEERSDLRFQRRSHQTHPYPVAIARRRVAALTGGPLATATAIREGGRDVDAPSMVVS